MTNFRGGITPDHGLLSATCYALGVAALRRLPALFAARPRPVIPVGPDTSSDKLRQCARCTACGRRGATIQRPSWSGTGRGSAAQAITRSAENGRKPISAPTRKHQTKVRALASVKSKSKRRFGRPHSSRSSSTRGPPEICLPEFRQATACTLQSIGVPRQPCSLPVINLLIRHPDDEKIKRHFVPASANVASVTIIRSSFSGLLTRRERLSGRLPRASWNAATLLALYRTRAP